MHWAFGAIAYVFWFDVPMKYIEAVDMCKTGSNLAYVLAKESSRLRKTCPGWE